MAEKIAQATFRGIAFAIEAADTEFGRRGELHQFPGRDQGFYEDLGAKDPAFTIDGFIGGRPDFEARRDALIRACNQPGPGELVHPYHGTRQVVCTGLRVRHSAKKRWLATLSISFVAAGSQPLPSVSPDRSRRLRDSGSAARQHNRAVFQQQFVLRGQPDHVSDEIARALDLGLAQMQQVARQLGTSADPAPALAGIIRRLQRLTSLLQDAASLGLALQAALQQIGNLAATPRQAYAVLSSLWQSGNRRIGHDWPALPVPDIGQTPQRQAQIAAQQALAGFLRREALIACALALGDTAFDHYDEAVASRDEMAAALEAEQQEQADIALYGSLGRLRADLVADISARATDLSRIARIILPATLPAFRLAYDLYGDASRADELAARNRLRHAGFVPGGTVLEVLADGASLDRMAVDYA